ncbi:MAG: hypothetical protein A49_27680 [Methyloceanibacter sp.]|nr:MAG: hypothetical protein A49_27680 [Methyloceanibacter sp.]
MRGAGGRAFALTPAGEALTHGHPSNLGEKAFVAVGQYWMPWMSLSYALRTGKPSFPFALNKKIADWRGRNADEGRFFFRYLAKEELANPGAVTDAIGDLGEGAAIVSLGGGYGAWLADVLNRHPAAQGIVFDAPPVLDDAKRLFEALDLTDRISLVAGDVLEDAPHGADVYVLKGVLQQHDDMGATAILKNCRAAMGPKARLLILERLMPETALDDPAAIMLDLHMMAITGGRARTKAEMEALIDDAGLTLAAVTEIEDGTSSSRPGGLTQTRKASTQPIQRTRKTALALQAWRSSTATKNPSVPWLRGVISNVSLAPSAEAGASTGIAASQTSRQGFAAKSGCRARKLSTCSRFSCGSTEQVM